MRRCSVDGSYTIFEVGCRFDRVKLVGVKPVFMKYAVDATHERRQVFLEVDALLDHLFHQINTPAHMDKRVIPRFVPSNPSLSYI